MNYADFDVLSFDCYGTLIDWESGLAAALAPLMARAGLALGRDDLLQRFAAVESAQQAETPDLAYDALLAVSHARLAREWGVAADAGADARFGASVGDWPAFPDSAAALARLKTRFKLVILSNVDRGSFAKSAAKLGVAFDAVHTAQDIGSYKPDPRNFRYLLDRIAEWGVPPGRLLHVAQSLFHDHAPANALGLPSVWIDRRAGMPGWGATTPPPPGTRWDARFETMADFAAAAMG